MTTLERGQQRPPLEAHSWAALGGLGHPPPSTAGEKSTDFSVTDGFEASTELKP